MFKLVQDYLCSGRCLTCVLTSNSFSFSYYHGTPFEVINMQVLTKYSLQNLLGSGIATSDQRPSLYSDLPSNMVCPFSLHMQKLYANLDSQVL